MQNTGKRVFRQECRRAFCNWRFFAALAAGIAIAVWQIAEYVYPASLKQSSMLAYGSDMICPTTVFSLWMGGGAFFYQQYLFFLLLPVLAALSYAASYRRDVEQGVWNNLVVRAGAKKVWTCRCFAVFLSGGCICVLPLLINLMTSMTMLSAAVPEIATFEYSLTNLHLGAELFYRFPWLYLLGYFLFDFCFSGLLAVFALAVSATVPMTYTVWFYPFFYCMLWSTIGSAADVRWLKPSLFLNPSCGVTNAAGMILEALLMLGIAAVVSLRVFRRKDYLSEGADEKR